MVEKRYYSVRAARDFLPEVRNSLIKIMKINKAIELISSVDFDFDDDYEYIWHDTKLNKKFHKLYFDFYNEYDKLLNAGVIIKDVDRGIVDFLSMHCGKEILLCYRMGESSINFWHYLEGDFNSRRHVSELELKKIK